ncbi:MAG: Ig-like domain-containing protein, partial [Thermoplasmata archaeon]
GMNPYEFDDNREDYYPLIEPVGTDTIPPTIRDIKAIPDPQEVGNDVNISTIITDIYGVFDAWIEIFDPDGLSLGNSSMFYDSVNGRYYRNLTYDKIGVYNFTIWANDTNLNLGSSSGSFMIQGTIPPTITDITILPNPQVVNGEVNISANVTDNYELFGVWIKVYDPDGFFIGNSSMLYDSINHRYYWNQTYGVLGEYTFTIWANDTNDNWESVSGSFIMDTIPPTITDTTALPDPQEVFEAVNISANITDNYQLFGAWVELRDPGGFFMGNFSMFYDPIYGRYYWNQTYDVFGTYTFTIWANDTGDTFASVSDTFVIQDNPPPIITDIVISPDPQEVLTTINISANVTDNNQLDGVWIEIFDPNANFVGNYSMLYDSENGRYYFNKVYNILGTYTFTIWANDTKDYWASESGYLAIQDITSPSIYDETAFPETQEIFENVNISATIIDNYQVLGIWIEIHDPDGNLVGNFSDIDTLFGWIFYLNRSYGQLGTYTFTIWVVDASDNWASESGVFTMQDTTEPQSEVDFIPLYRTATTFTVSATVNDATEVQIVELWYSYDDGEWVLYDNDTSAPWSWNFDTLTAGGDGIYQFYSRANDTSGNYEDAPSENDTWTIVDTRKPQSGVDILPTFTTTITFNLTAQANDTNGVRRVELWYKEEDGEWILYNRDTTAPWSWEFNTSEIGGDGIYQFYSRAFDFSGNYEDAHLGNDTWTIVDTAKPMIIETVPIDGAIDVEPTSNLTIIFSETMDTESVEDAFSYTDGDVTWYIIDGEATWSSTYHNYDTLIFNPHEDFLEDTNYQVFIVNTAKDLAGNSLVTGDKANPWSFTTAPPAPPSKKENLKPLIALMFAAILLVIGLITAKKRPLVSKIEKLTDEYYTFFTTALPFVIVEIITGITSLFIGALEVPSWLGIGMIVDLIILIFGIISCAVVFMKGGAGTIVENKGDSIPSELQSSPPSQGL